jgi:hypothetical protein
VDDRDLIAAYIGVIRHELKLRPGTDALLAAEARLSPPDADDRPPPRAPGIARLAKALRRLRRHAVPEASLEQFSDDLRFLRLFEPADHVLERDALDRLLGNVIQIPPPKRASKPRPAGDTAPVVPFRRRKSGDNA